MGEGALGGEVPGITNGYVGNPARRSRARRALQSRKLTASARTQSRNAAISAR